MTFSALDSALLGPLFATDAMRAVFSDQARLAAMLQVEAALAEAEAAEELAPDGLATAIRAIDPASLDLEALGRATAVAGVPTIPFVEAVGKRLPPDLEAAFHKGATTQDIIDTALVLQIRDALDLLGPDLDRTIAGLVRLARAHRETPCVGRTYGQQAAPLTFGFRVAVWAAGIDEVRRDLPHVRDAVLSASLAGPVGTLGSLGQAGPAVLDRFAGLLDLRTDPIAWHVRRARIARIGCWLAMLTATLAKMAEDVVRLCQTEIGEVAEPHVLGRGGSTAMPHKRNPVCSTVILAAHAAAPGHVATLLTAMAGAGERPAGLWHAEWHALGPLFGLASGACGEADALAHGLEVDVGRMRANLDATHGLLFADAVASRLAPSLGREQAHLAVERAAVEVRRSGRHLREIIADDTAVAGIDLAPAFDIASAVEAAARWVDRALEAIESGHDRLTDDPLRSRPPPFDPPPSGL